MLDARESDDSIGEPIPLVFGETIVPGLRVYRQFGDGILSSYWSGVPSGERFGTTTFRGVGTGKQKKSEFALMQDVLAFGPIESIDDILIGNTPITVPVSQDGYAGLVFGQKKLNGGASQLATALCASSHFPSERGSTAKFTGLAYVTSVAWHDVDSDKIRFFDVPRFNYIGKFRKCRTPKTPTAAAAYSNNMVRVLFEFLTNTQYGPRLADTDIDLASLGAGEDTSAVIVQGPQQSIGTYKPPAIWTNSAATYSALFSSLGLSNASGLNDTSVKTGLNNRNLLRYEFNGTLPSDAEWSSVVKDRILSTCPGAILFMASDGKLKLSLPDAHTAVASQVDRTITDADLLEDGIQVSTPSLNSRMNQVSVGFTNIELDFASDQVVFPRTGSKAHLALLAEDHGMRLSQSIEVPGANTKYHALSVAATLIMLSRRSEYKYTLDYSSLITVEPGDIHKLDSDTLRVKGKYVRVQRVAPRGRLCEVTATEFEPSDFAWTTESKSVIGHVDSVGGGDEVIWPFGPQNRDAWQVEDSAVWWRRVGGAVGTSWKQLLFAEIPSGMLGKRWAFCCNVPFVGGSNTFNPHQFVLAMFSRDTPKSDLVARGWMKNVILRKTAGVNAATSNTGDKTLPEFSVMAWLDWRDLDATKTWYFETVLRRVAGGKNTVNVGNHTNHVFVRYA